MTSYEDLLGLFTIYLQDEPPILVNIREAIMDQFGTPIYLVSLRGDIYPWPNVIKMEREQA